MSKIKQIEALLKKWEIDKRRVIRQCKLNPAPIKFKILGLKAALDILKDSPDTLIQIDNSVVRCTNCNTFINRNGIIYE